MCLMVLLIKMYALKIKVNRFYPPEMYMTHNVLTYLKITFGFLKALFNSPVGYFMFFFKHKLTIVLQWHVVYLIIYEYI